MINKSCPNVSLAHKVGFSTRVLFGIKTRISEHIDLISPTGDKNVKILKFKCSISYIA